MDAYTTQGKVPVSMTEVLLSKFQTARRQRCPVTRCECEWFDPEGNGFDVDERSRVCCSRPDTPAIPSSCCGCMRIVVNANVILIVIMLFIVIIIKQVDHHHHHLRHHHHHHHHHHHPHPHPHASLQLPVLILKMGKW